MLVYAASLRFGFVHDDHFLVESNPLIREGGRLGRLLVADFWAVTGESSGMWRPLVLLSMWVDARVFHVNPAGFHLVNILVHAAVTGLLATLMLQSGLTRAAALLGALWFAAMPVHVESVAWVAGRTDVLCALFLTMALALDRRARFAGRPWSGVSPVVAFGLALLSKESALMGLGLFAVADWAERRDPRVTLGRRTLWLLPFLVVAALYLVAHALWVGGARLPAYFDPALSTRYKWAAWMILPTHVAGLWTWFPHSPIRMLPIPSAAWAWDVWAGIVLQLGFAAALIAMLVRRSRFALPVALFWFPMLPTFVLAVWLGYLVHGERLIYLPSAGAAWALCLTGEAALSRARRAFPGASARAVAWAGAALAVVWIAASAFRTIQLLPDWRDDAAMFHAVVREEPDNAQGRVGWALWLADHDREAEALRELAVADSLDPRLPEMHVALGQVHARHGRWPLALASAERALALDSLRRDARVLEITAQMRLGRLDEAETRLRRLMSEEPGEPHAESLWGQLLMVRNRDEEALLYLTRATRWITDDASLEFALGTVQLRQRRAPQARLALERTVELAPAFYEGWLRLAVARAVTGDLAGAAGAIDRAGALPEASDGRAERLRTLLASAPR
jgi:tetratricopeptide (TPR) repeat protein